MISIKYFDKFTSQNNNLVIFITKLAELRTISLPFGLNSYLDNQSLISTLNKKKSLEVFHITKKPKIHYKIILKIVDIHNNNYFSSGSSIYDKFDYKEVKNLTFVFSKIIEKKNIIPQIILSYQIQSYNFDKYLSKKKLYPKNLLISRKNNKINFNSINYNSNLVKSINFTKDLISEPANTLNPVTYAQRCKKINIQGLKIKIL